MQKEKNYRIAAISTALFLLIAIGVAGYMYLEDMTFLDALYMTVITVSTVGFKEVVDLEPHSKVFTIGIIVSGLGIVAYAASNFFSFLLEGEFKNIVRRRRMEKKINSLSDHFILCGGGQTGQSVIERFQRAGAPFVVVEKDPPTVEDLISQNVPVFQGDATHEEVLEKAGITKAKGLISCLSNDAENVFAVLTARGMNPDIHIVARSIEKKSHSKLLKAGANCTISPNELGGVRMASMLLKPAVVSFLDIITQVKDMTLDLEEVELHPKSSLVEKTLGDARIPEKIGLIVLAIKKKNEERLRLNPRSLEKLEQGDKMLVLGTDDQVKTLKKIAMGSDE